MKSTLMAELNFGYDSSSVSSARTAVRDVMGRLNDDKIENIGQIIKEINELIVERQKLSEILISSYEKLLSKINEILYKLPPSTFKEEIALSSKFVEVEEQKTKEKLDCWRDVALLKKELRERLSEFREEEQKKSNISNFLDSD